MAAVPEPYCSRHTPRVPGICWTVRSKPFGYATITGALLCTCLPLCRAASGTQLAQAALLATACMQILA